MSLFKELFCLHSWFMPTFKLETPQQLFADRLGLNLWVCRKCGKQSVHDNEPVVELSPQSGKESN